MWESADTTANYEGGFIDDSQREGLGDDVKKEDAEQTIVPVMTKHLISAHSVDNVKLYNISARIFTFVGIVRRVEETTTKISYDIEDETGTITALKWLEADKKMPESIVEVNTYVRVHGLLREENDKRHVLILHVRPLTDLNELTCHLLEVTYASLKAKAMAEEDHVPQETTDTLSSGMTPNQAIVYNIIQAENHTLRGIEKSEILSRVPANIRPLTDQILDFLVSEGHIYTTESDDYFKTT